MKKIVLFFLLITVYPAYSQNTRSLELITSISMVEIPYSPVFDLSTGDFTFEGLCCMNLYLEHTPPSSKNLLSCFFNHLAFRHTQQCHFIEQFTFDVGFNYLLFCYS